jgi:hypothetical protein
MKSLKESLKEIAANGNDVVETPEFVVTVDKTTAYCNMFQIEADGRRFNIPRMPTFGKRNMNASRVHLARGGRYIEAMPYAKFLGVAAHNSDNGKMLFIRFVGTELPTPCTTKVKFQEECPIFKKMTIAIRKQLNEAMKPTTAPAPPPQAPKPLPLPVSASVQAPLAKTLLPVPVSKSVTKTVAKHITKHLVNPAPAPVTKHVTSPNPAPVVPVPTLETQLVKLCNVYGYEAILSVLNEINGRD